MKLKAFKLFSFYSVIALYDFSLDKDPVTSWAERHVRQGFSWRSQSVSFGLLSDIGEIYVEVYLEKELIRFRDDCLRSIITPFDLKKGNMTIFSDLVNDEVVEMKNDNYQVMFSTGWVEKSDDSQWVEFCFVRSHEIKFEIPIIDDALSPEYPLLTHTTPA